MDKKSLSERDICTKFITPALVNSGWDTQLQIREEVSFTDGKIYVRGKMTARGKRKRPQDIAKMVREKRCFGNIPLAILLLSINNGGMGRIPHVPGLFCARYSGTYENLPRSRS